MKETAPSSLESILSGDQAAVALLNDRDVPSWQVLLEHLVLASRANRLEPPSAELVEALLGVDPDLAGWRERAFRVMGHLRSEHITAAQKVLVILRPWLGEAILRFRSPESREGLAARYELALFDADALEVARAYFRLRMELFPYVFHYLLRASETGRPMVRSLWMAYPDDRQTRDHERDFLFGPDLLVAPVYIEGATDRELYLPAGDWVDFWTAQRIDGSPAQGQVHLRDTPIDVIPLYVRDGALIPMADPTIDTLVDATEEGVVSYQDVPHLRLLAVPSSSPAELALFNGVTATSALVGDDVHLSISVGDPPADVDERVAFPPEDFTLHLLLDGLFDGPPSAVTIDGAPVPAGDDCRPCYTFDDDRRTLDITLDGPGDIEVSP